MNRSDLGMSCCDAASGTQVNGLSVLQSQDLLTTPLAANQGGYSSGGKESVPKRDALRRAEVFFCLIPGIPGFVYFLFSMTLSFFPVCSDFLGFSG